MQQNDNLRIRGNHLELIHVPSDIFKVLDLQRTSQMIATAKPVKQISSATQGLSIHIPDLTKFGFKRSKSGVLKMKGMKFEEKETISRFRIPENVGQMNIYDFSNGTKTKDTIILKLIEKEKGNDVFIRRLKDVFEDLKR